jgi:hypothetical protein
MTVHIMVGLVAGFSFGVIFTAVLMIFHPLRTSE